jgi:hypothetical protein
MLYECNSCKVLIEEGDIEENSLGDLVCPE